MVKDISKEDLMDIFNLQKQKSEMFKKEIFDLHDKSIKKIEKTKETENIVSKVVQF